tara:strand:- start:1594 stop:2760 length:1167 start_codon:yes stop_codon:yes gene_type:complete
LVYTPLSNWRHEEKKPHRIQSGPDRVNTPIYWGYNVVSSGIDDVGVSRGVITPGPPNSTYTDLGYSISQTIYVTIDSITGGLYRLDGRQGAEGVYNVPPVVRLFRGGTYTFDQSDATNVGHQIRFSATSDGTHGGGTVWTEGVTYEGTPGVHDPAYTRIVVPQDAPDTLYYYCVNHTGMGNFCAISDTSAENSWFLTDNWRAVPTAVSGYWTDNQHVDVQPSGNFLSAYKGYRPVQFISTANAQVQTSYGPEWGTRSEGTYAYFGGTSPDAQGYNPYNTPDDNTTAQGQTGGGSLQPTYSTTLLTNSTPGSRPSSWTYNQPVYCRTYSEAVRSDEPGNMSTVNRYIYRGRSAQYTSNYGSIYHTLPESVRNMVRTYSSTVNSSNQKNY